MKPQRIQRKRTKAWRMPPNTVYVGRPGPWGNPFNWQDEKTPHFGDSVAKGLCKIRYEDWLQGELTDVDHLEDRRQWILSHAHELRGKNLACWCRLDQCCHADVLMEMANKKDD